jgi:hypothetical protein
MNNNSKNLKIFSILFLKMNDAINQYYEKVFGKISKELNSGNQQVISLYNFFCDVSQTYEKKGVNSDNLIKMLFYTKNSQLIRLTKLSPEDIEKTKCFITHEIKNFKELPQFYKKIYQYLN